MKLNICSRNLFAAEYDCKPHRLIWSNQINWSFPTPLTASCFMEIQKNYQQILTELKVLLREFKWLFFNGPLKLVFHTHQSAGTPRRWTWTVRSGWPLRTSPRASGSGSAARHPSAARSAGTHRRTDAPGRCWWSAGNVITEFFLTFYSWNENLNICYL